MTKIMLHYTYLEVRSVDGDDKALFTPERSDGAETLVEVVEKRVHRTRRVDLVQVPAFFVRRLEAGHVNGLLPVQTPFTL